jgi:Lactonase, 7-bladed beta-propeller
VNQAQNPASLAVFDISVPGTITSVGICALPDCTQPTPLYVSGTTGFVADYFSKTLSILDLSSTATLASTITLSSAAPNYIAFSSGGTTAYLGFSGNPGTIDCVDFTYPYAASVLNTFIPDSNVPNIVYLLVNGTTLYSANKNSQDICVINISDPSNPQLRSVGTVTTSGAPVFLNIDPTGNYLYAVNNDSPGTLATFDISNVENVSFLNATTTGGDSPQMALLSAPLAYVPNYNPNSSNEYCFGILDLTEAGTPTFLGTVNAQGPQPIYMSASNGFGLVVNYGAGETSSIGYFDLPTTVAEAQTLISSTIGTITTGGSVAPNLITYQNTGYVANQGNGGVGANIGVFIFPQPAPPSDLPLFSANTRVTAGVLNSLNGQVTTPEATQSIITGLLGKSYLEQEQDIAELNPQFKVIQYSLEKLDLLLHKELERELYSTDKGGDLFVLAGYDNLTQNGKGRLSGLNGYNVDTPYQLIGSTQKVRKVKFIQAIGASESYMQLNPAHARAKYQTVWGDLGISAFLSNWQLGLDGLFGYSFIHTKRYIDYLGDKSNSNHGAWNASVLFRVAYEIKRDDTSFTPYDNVSYIYGQENSYTEKGAPGANFHVKNENISTIRNELGFKVKAPISRFSHLFFDGAWLYEKYLNNQTYLAAFVDTNVYGTYRQVVPTKNYGRFETGLVWHKNHVDWQFVYTGLYGRKFAESSGSIKFSYKF